MGLASQPVALRLSQLALPFWWWMEEPAASHPFHAKKKFSHRPSLLEAPGTSKADEESAVERHSMLHHGRAPGCLHHDETSAAQRCTSTMGWH